MYIIQQLMIIINYYWKPSINETNGDATCNFFHLNADIPSPTFNPYFEETLFQSSSYLGKILLEIILGVGALWDMPLFCPTHWLNIYIHICLNWKFRYFITKAVSNRDILIINAVLLWCGHRHFSLIFTSKGQFAPPPLIYKNGRQSGISCFASVQFQVDDEINIYWVMFTISLIIL